MKGLDGGQKIYTLAGMGGAALAASVALPW